MSDPGNCKVDHIIDRYDLTAPGGEFADLDEYLVEMWKGNAGLESVGYKRLTEIFNKRLLKHVYESNGRETVGTRLESDYEALTGDDDILRQEVLDDLAADGIDGESLGKDMISWSTMRRHLKGCLDEQKEQQTAQTEWEIESVDIARERLEEKTQSALRSYSKKGTLPDADKAEVDVQVKVSCPECPTRVPLKDALERGFVCKDHFDTAPDPKTVHETAPSDPGAD